MVLLDFWATWCGPCQRALPDTNTIAQKFAGQVVTLGINVWDEQSAFTNWLPSHKNLSSMTFVHDTTPRTGKGVGDSYGIAAIPSQYVIGRNGKIFAAFCVATPEQLTAALNKALQAQNIAP